MLYSSSSLSALKPVPLGVAQPMLVRYDSARPMAMRSGSQKPCLTWLNCSMAWPVILPSKL